MNEIKEGKKEGAGRRGMKGIIYSRIIRKQSWIWGAEGNKEHKGTHIQPYN